MEPKDEKKEIPNNVVMNNDGLKEGVESSQIEQPSNQNPEQSKENDIKEDNDEKPLRRIGFLILGLLVASSYLLLTIYLVGIPITLDWISLSSGSIQVFAGSYPLIGPLVVISMSATIIIVYASLKVLSASRKSIYSLLLTLVCLPILVSICLAIIANKSTFAGLFPLLPSDFSLQEIFGSISGWTYIILPITIVWMLLSLKKFTKKDQGLGRWSTIIFVTFLGLFVAPILGVLSFMYYKAYFPNTNYTQVEEMTSFHIMEPNWLPPEYHQNFAYKYYEADEEYKEYVTTSFDVPILELGSEESSGLILLRQGISIEEYDYAVNEDFEVTEEILNNSRDGVTDLLFYEGDSGNYMYNLSYYTDEDVHIFITGVNLPPEDLIQFANGLD